MELLFLMRFCDLDQFEFTVIQHQLRVLSWLNSVYRSVGPFQEAKSVHLGKGFLRLVRVSFIPLQG